MVLPSVVYYMVTPEEGKSQVMVMLVLLLRMMTGAAHCSFTVPLPTAEGIMFSFTAMALIRTLLTFSVNGPVYSVLEVVGVLPSVV